MNDPQGLVSFPGLTNFTRAEYVLSQGITPGVCVIETTDISQLAPFGDLTFSYGGQSVTLTNCTVDFANLKRGQGGYVYTVQILDRRWLWRVGGHISGHYNLRLAGGANADEGFSSKPHPGQGDTTNILDGTEKAPQDLATLCLQAMGEQNYDVSALPNSARPEVHWSYDNPADVLASLCESLGCRVVLQLAGDSVRVVKIGEGDPLPDNSSVTFASQGANPPETPSALLLVGGPTIYQGFLPLQAVGIDRDGSLQPIDQLSYKPSGGWTREVPESWPSLTDPLVKALAEKSIYKLWRIGGSADAPIEVPDENRTTIDDPYLPQFQLLDRLIDTHADTDEPGNTVHKKPEIWGIFEPLYSQYPETTDVNRVYKESLTVDAARWLIVSRDPLYRHQGSQYLPATLNVKIAYAFRDLETLEPVRYTRGRSLNAQVSTQAQVVHRDEIVLKAVGTFDENFRLTGVVDNRSADNLDDEADYYLDAAEAEYVEKDSFDVPYAGLVPIDVDGLIQQVTYSIVCGPAGSTTTRASLNCEHNPYVEPFGLRRRAERQRGAPRIESEVRRFFGRIGDDAP